MLLNPHYGAPAMRVMTETPDIRRAFLGQQRRMMSTAAALTDQQLLTPSRCEGWSAADVLEHLGGVAQFWMMSMAAGVAGEPTTILSGFDPEATPREMVAGSDAASVNHVREQYLAAAAQLDQTIAALGDDEWDTIVEAPPGHVTIGTMLHHALWDCWTHERDIVLPLGIEPVEDPVEVTCVLAHAIGLTAAVAMQFADSRSARIGVLAVDPLVELTVNVARTTVVSFDSPPAGVPVLTGSAVDLVEGITCRQPLDLSSLGEQAWVVEGLAEVFAPAGPSEV